MKWTMVCIVCSLLLSLNAVKAQQDTSLNQQRVQQPTPPPQKTTPARQIDQYRQQDRVLVPQDQLPVQMRETLRGNQYQGWENSEIYQDRTTGEYSLDITNPTQSKRTYRFDKNGRLMDDPNRPQQGIDKDQ